MREKSKDQARAERNIAQRAKEARAEQQERQAQAIAEREEREEAEARAEYEATKQARKAHREIICCWNWSYNEKEGKIYIDLENEVNYRRLNNELKCLNILYEVLGIKGTKEEIIEEYHHLIN